MDDKFVSSFLLKLTKKHLNFIIYSSLQDCRMDEGQKCFRSGDVRVNEHPGLVRTHLYTSLNCSNYSLFFSFWKSFERSLAFLRLGIVVNGQILKK